MDYFPATEGILMLKKELAIETDHKIFASSLSVTLLNENEFEEYDKSVVYPDGSRKFPVSINQIFALMNISDNYINLRPFTEYLYSLSWNENNFIEIIRKLLGETLQISQEIDPSKKRAHSTDPRYMRDIFYWTGRMRWNCI